jgi:chemotaxis protein methyltransferase WspC
LIEAPGFRAGVRARMRELGIVDDAAYAALLERDSVEAARAHAIVAVPETWLFRGRASFELLRSEFARRGVGDGTLRLLSAGSAGGAEAASLVITARAAGWPLERIEVDAVDLNGDAIAGGRDGRYSSFALREALPEWALPSIDRQCGEIVVEPAVMARIRWHVADLFRWAPPHQARYASIFCRNLLIYLAAPARSELIARLVAWLEPEGILVLGHADAVGAQIPECQPIGEAAAFAHRKGEPRTPERVAAPPQPASLRSSAPRAQLVRPASREAKGLDLPAIRSLAERGAIDEALVAAERFVRTASTSPDGHALVGELRRARGDPRGAEEAFMRAVYLDPRNEQALLALAALAEARGDRRMADRHRDRALRAHLDGTPE